MIKILFIILAAAIVAAMVLIGLGMAFIAFRARGYDFSPSEHDYD